MRQWGYVVGLLSSAPIACSTQHVNGDRAGDEGGRPGGDTYTNGGDPQSGVDECSLDLDDCDSHATCYDRDLGYDCECDEGYDGDGRTCTPSPVNVELVYDDDLQSRWLESVWPCVNPAEQQAEVHGGADAYEVQHCVGGWGGFGFVRRSPSWEYFYMYPNQFKRLSFWFNPGAATADDAGLEVTADRGAAVTITDALGGSPTANTWHRVEVDIADLLSAGERFVTLTLFNASGNQAHYFIDDVQLDWVSDGRPPVISDVSQGFNLPGDEVILSWRTDEHTIGSVEWGIGDYAEGPVSSDEWAYDHDVVLSALTAGTTYQYRITASDHQEETITPSNTEVYFGTFDTPAADVTDPVLSNVRVTTLRPLRATVCWDTDEPADGELRWGDTGGALDQNASVASYELSHCLDAPGLQAGQTYDYRVAASDSSGNSASSAILSLTTPLSAPADLEVAVDATRDVRAISPLIYGHNHIGHEIWEDAAEAPTFGRLGGNRWTAYNWENNASNAGEDYYHQNDGFLVMHADPGRVDDPGEAVRYRFERIFAAGAAALVTVPILGYVAQDKNGNGDVNQTPDYLVARFDPMVPAKSGGVFTLTPDLGDGAVYADEYVNWVEITFPRGAATPEIFYSLDNEPDLWSGTHERIHPDPVGYAELVTKCVDTAQAIKDREPDARIFGPVNYGWYGFVTLQDAPDRAGQDFINFFLGEMQTAAGTYGARLLDVLDLHWYPEARGAGVRITADDASPAVAAARMQAPRSLWDPDYVEDSWIANGVGAIRLIPLMQDKIATHYPGTGLAFTEYYYGGGAHISGGIAQADVLGIFAREQVFAANLWHLGSTDDRFIWGAHAMYRNFDGAGGRFGDTHVAATIDDKATGSAYASLDTGTPNQMVIIVINKTRSWQYTEIEIQNAPFVAASADLFRLTAASSRPQSAGTRPIISGGSLLYDDLPPQSVTTYNLEP